MLIKQRPSTTIEVKAARSVAACCPARSIVVDRRLDYKKIGAAKLPVIITYMMSLFLIAALPTVIAMFMCCFHFEARVSEELS